MMRLLALFALLSLFVGCEKQVSFDSVASDDMIYPGATLGESTWIRLDSLTSLSLSDISFCDENTGMISGFGGTVYFTKDGGENWRTVNTNANMTFLSIFSLDKNTYFTARNGLYKSTDGGYSWKRTNLLSEISVFDIWFKDESVGFLTSGAGTYVTTDAGESWTKLLDEIVKDMQFTSDQVGYFSCGSTAVYKSAGNNLPSYGDIYRTTDGGKTWKKMGLDVAEIVSMSFVSDRIGFFATNGNSLYKTTDGGETVSLIGINEFYCGDMFFVNENEGIVCTGTGISITNDGGKTFRQEYTHTGKGQVYDLEFPSPSAGYAIGNGGLIIKRVQQ